MRFQVSIEFRQHDTGLHPDPLFGSIKLDDLVEMFAEIDQNPFPQLIAGPARAAAAGGDRDFMFAGEPDRFDEILL